MNVAKKARVILLLISHRGWKLFSDTSRPALTDNSYEQVSLHEAGSKEQER